MKKLIIIAAAIAALSSCCCKNAESSIANTAFNIIELNGTEYQSLGDKPAFIAFEDSTCNASVGGNSIFASYKEDKDGKRFEGSYVDNKRDGEFVEKDRNGNVIATGVYVRGQRREDK